jgi:hypothetical protein
MPIVSVPCFRTGGGLDGHPAFFRSLQMLREYGMRVLYEPETYPPKNQVPPDVILDVLDETLRNHGRGRNQAEMERYSSRIRTRLEPNLHRPEWSCQSYTPPVLTLETQPEPLIPPVCQSASWEYRERYS